MRFSEKVVVVTGAGSGIGEAASIRLAEEGANVVLVGRTKEKLTKVAETIGDKAKVFVGDVTKESDVEELANFVREQHGDLHVLINNAGGSKQSTSLNTSLEDWEYVQAVNLRSVFLVSKALGKVMIEASCNGGGQQDRSIVNIASLSAYKAGSQIPHYSAAKAGVVNYSRSLANELAPYGVRVNSVSPGFVETPLTEAGLQNKGFQDAIKRHTALKRVGRPEEIANIITFVASSEASYMTGSDVLADGGWLIT